MSMMSLRSLFEISKRAFTAILVGSIMAILIGSTLLVITYVVLSPFFTTASTVLQAANTSSGSGAAAMNASWVSMQTTITQSLTIVGIALIVAGVAGIIYMLMGVAGMTGGARGR